MDPGSLSVGAVRTSMLQLALQHCEEEDSCVSVGGDRYGEGEGKGGREGGREGNAVSS